MVWLPSPRDDIQYHAVTSLFWHWSGGPGPGLFLGHWEWDVKLSTFCLRPSLQSVFGGKNVKTRWWTFQDWHNLFLEVGNQRNPFVVWQEFVIPNMYSHCLLLSERITAHNGTRNVSFQRCNCLEWKSATKSSKFPSGREMNAEKQMAVNYCCDQAAFSDYHSTPNHHFSAEFLFQLSWFVTLQRNLEVTRRLSLRTSKWNTPIPQYPLSIM